MALLRDEDFFVGHHEWVADRRENADLVQCVLLFLFRQVEQLDLFQRVLLAVGVARYLVHGGVGALA